MIAGFHACNCIMPARTRTCCESHIHLCPASLVNSDRAPPPAHSGTETGASRLAAVVSPCEARAQSGCTRRRTAAAAPARANNESHIQARMHRRARCMACQNRSLARGDAASPVEGRIQSDNSVHACHKDCRDACADARGLAILHGAVGCSAAGAHPANTHAHVLAPRASALDPADACLSTTAQSVEAWSIGCHGQSAVR